MIPPVPSPDRLPNAFDALNLLLAEAVASLRATRGFIALVNEDTGELSVSCTVGDGWDDDRRRRRLRIGQQEGKGITAYVAATGNSYRTGNVRGDSFYVEFFDDVISEVAAPMVDLYGRVIGVVNIDSNRQDAFDEGHELLLKSLAGQAALTLTMADYRARETALIEVGNELTLNRSPERLMDKVVDTAAHALRSDDASLLIVDSDRAALRLHASRGALAHSAIGATYQLGEGLTGWVAQHGAAIRTEDPRADSRWRGIYPELPPDQVGAFLAVPVHGAREVLGVLRVVRRRRTSRYYHHEFTDEDESLLLTLANQIGVAVETSRLVQRLAQSERMAAWGEMSARSAHMLGNRMFAMRGTVNELEFLLSQPAMNRDSLREQVEALKSGMFRLEEILLEFRDFVMATRLTTQPEDLNSIVRRAVEDALPHDCEVVLRMDLDPDLPPVPADAAKLGRALTELAENSVRWQPNGGRVCVRTGRAVKEEAALMPDLPRDRDYALIEFADEGPGIPEANKQKIFNPFFTTRAKGMGLGLSIVKGVIEGHGGNIVEVGQPARGARFVILLPMADD